MSESNNQGNGQQPGDPKNSMRRLSFSQANGYEPIPQQLKLEDLPSNVRTKIWNVFFIALVSSKDDHEKLTGDWLRIMMSVHCQYLERRLETWRPQLSFNSDVISSIIDRQPFNKVFDLLQFVMQRKSCPVGFIRAMQQVFSDGRLAYFIDFDSEANKPPTIIPIASEEEGKALAEAFVNLRETGHTEAAEYLKKASELIMAGNWRDSIKESVSAVEFVVKNIVPDSPKNLSSAIDKLDSQGQPLHRALKETIKKLYGFASDEPNIRHAADAKKKETKVGLDEALLCLSICASVSSYLTRRYVEER